MLRILGLALGVVSVVVTSFIFYQSMRSFNQFSKHPLNSPSVETAKVEEGEHGAPNPHGGGHGEHGEKSDGEKRETASAKMVPFMSLDELFANINQEKQSHTLAIKVDVEFFDVESKQTFKSNQPAVKHLIIQTSREQEYDQISTLSGKLYYKELLIRRINEYFQKPLVKDVHFASFFLQ